MHNSVTEITVYATSRSSMRLNCSSTRLYKL